MYSLRSRLPHDTSSTAACTTSTLRRRSRICSARESSGAPPQASSVSLAELLLGRLTSPTQAARRADVRLLLQDALNRMDPLDREVLTLRHFEELSNGEVAQVPGLTKMAASNRYIRALERLREILAGVPGLLAP